MIETGLNCNHNWQYVKNLDICHQYGHLERCVNCNETRDVWFDRNPFDAWSFMHLDADCPGCQQIMNAGLEKLPLEQNLFGILEAPPIFSTITEDNLIDAAGAE